MRFLLVVFSLFMCGEGLNAVPSSESRIAAIVNNNVITKADLMNRLRFAAISSGLEPTPENLDRLKAQILRIMIDETLQLQIGEKYGIDIPKEHLNAAIKDIEDSNGMPAGAIANMMKETGIPFKTFEDQMRAQLIWLIYIREKYPLKNLEIQKQEGLPSLQIADWEINQEVKLQKERDTKTQYHLAEIVLPLDGATSEEEIKQNLNNLTEELQKGAQFGALAQQFSQAATSAQGGDMGWLTEDQVEPEIKEALSHMQPGQLSAPIRTSQGYSLIAFIERKLPGAEESSLITMQQVLLPFPKDATEDQARAIMKIAEGLTQSAKSCPDLEKMAREKFPSVSLHMMRDEPLSAFPAPLQEVLNRLTINQASEPLLTQEGGLVVMLCDKKSRKVEEFSREDAEGIIAGRKHTLIARREMRDLRRHAFIDLRM
jgi:peptidyl-prolyl cis-trans isomerase SurA